MSKIEENEKRVKRKAISLALSVLIHGGLLLSIFYFTVELTMPVGNVSGTLEFNAVAPEGSQLETLNVAPVAQPEVPEKIKQEPAPAAPPPHPVVKKNSAELPVKKTEPVKETLPEPVDEGTLPTEVAAQTKEIEPAQEEISQPEVEPSPQEEPPVVAQIPATPPETLPEKVDKDAPTQAMQSALSPVVGPGANKAVVTGNDSVDLKGQERVSDQNYGVPGGVKMADQYLRPIPGNKMPEYPWMARLRRIEGQVMVVFSVNSAGEVSNLRITQSTNEVFNDSVLKAMSSWKFSSPSEPGEYAKPWVFSLKGEAQDVPTRYKKK